MDFNSRENSLEDQGSSQKQSQQHEVEEKKQEKFETDQLLCMHWIKSCKVSGHTEKKGILNSHVVFRLDVVLDSPDEKNFQIERRYNDFKAFRETLRKLLPCHYLRNLH